MRERETWVRAFLAALVVIGLLLVAWGATEGHSVNKPFNFYVVLAACGGAMLGSSIELFLHRLIASEEERKLLHVLDSRLVEMKGLLLSSPRLTSSPDDLSHLEGRWHQYNVTKKDQRTSWIHTIYEIRSSQTGELAFDVEYKNKQGRTRVYRYSGFARDDRVVFVGKEQGSQQPCFVEIWPHLLNAAGSHYCGLCVNQSWDLDDVVTPCLLTRQPIGGRGEPDDSALNDIWLKGFSATRVLLSSLPSAGSTQGTLP